MYIAQNKSKYVDVYVYCTIYCLLIYGHILQKICLNIWIYIYIAQNMSKYMDVHVYCTIYVLIYGRIYILHNICLNIWIYILHNICLNISYFYLKELLRCTKNATLAKCYFICPIHNLLYIFDQHRWIFSNVWTRFYFLLIKSKSECEV